MKWRNRTSCIYSRVYYRNPPVLHWGYKKCHAKAEKADEKWLILQVWGLATFNVSSLLHADAVCISCRSIPASHFCTLFSPLCTPYYHAPLAWLGAHSPLLLGNFRRAILVHCLDLDRNGVRECVCVSGCGCVGWTETERECVCKGGRVGERDWEYVWGLFGLFLLWDNDPRGEGDLFGILDPGSSCLSIWNLHW